MLSPCVFRALARPPAWRGVLHIHRPRVLGTLSPSSRLFTTTAAFRQERSVKTEAVPTPPGVTKAGAKPKDMLAEPTLTTQEQRKADWGIIKEMSRYLWPKVGIRQGGGGRIGDEC